MSVFWRTDVTAKEDATPRLLSRGEMRVAALRNLALVSAPEGAGGVVEERLTSITSLSVQGEALRAALWALSAQGSEPVYITRLLHAAHPLTAAVPLEMNSDGSDNDSALRLLGKTLDELEAIGDVASLPHGRWLPAPMRCVLLPMIRRWVFLGGMPTHRLSLALRKSLEHNGVARLLTTDPAVSGLLLPVQDQDDWIRKPPEPLRDWTCGIMDSVTLRPFDDSEATFDYYAPSAALINLQYYHWVANSNALPDARYLARYRAKRGPTSYSLVEVRRGKVVATGSLDVEERDIRRLLYGLDSLAGRSVRIRVTRTRTGWMIELRNELPAAEHRLFTALGRLHLSPDGAYYPRRWEVADRYAVQAMRALHNLDVHLDGADELLCAVREIDSD